jgi:hypothetical protein
MKEGWICPKCGGVWSPTTAGCCNCNQIKVGSTSIFLKDHYCTNPRTDGSCGCGANKT